MLCCGILSVYFLYGFQKQGKAAKSQQEQPAAKPIQELQAKLAAVQEELLKAKAQLGETEKEKGKVLEELERARKVADEANARLQEALDLQWKAMEAAEAEKSYSLRSEQADVESVQRKLESMQSQQEADADVLRATVEQLEKARYELADAIDAKNEALSQADDATMATEVKAEQVELLSAEIKRLKELVDSKFDGKAKKTPERIQKLDSENSKLKLELEKAKAAQERVAQLERMVEELNIDVADANNTGSKSNELADEWQKKAQLLEVRLEEAEESNVLKSESLDSAMKELDTTSNLLRGRESEVAVLQEKVRLLEDEVARQKGDIDMSGEQLDAADKEAAELWREVEERRLKLRAAEQEKMEALNSDRISEIEALTEQKNQLAKELEVSKDEVEKVKKAMEGLASALHEMSAESREAREKYLTKQDEIERTQAQVEELEMSLKNTKENYEVMLDEANYEKVCLTKSVERMEAEARNAHEEWQSKELGFVNSINKSQDEIVSIKAQMDKTLEAVKERETENAELQEKIQQLEAQLIEANKIREEDGSSKEENDGDSQADLESSKEDATLDIKGLHLTKENSGSTSPTKQHQHQKKQPLLKRFGGLLKKKSDH
jgi:chromosome segregation ATPase